ncbi:MAG: orotidine 5-phosphate decarboxylase [Rhodobacteraceae bacterium]|nr:orotidine 5-phosphate decarboxylase [Paracoccaceae bacterium]
MQAEQVQITDVTYNAMSQRFEALVTVRDAGAVRRYPCAVPAPITLPLRDAAGALRRQALRRARRGQSIGTRVVPAPAARRPSAPTPAHGLLRKSA